MTLPDQTRSSLRRTEALLKRLADPYKKGRFIGVVAEAEKCLRHFPAGYEIATAFPDHEESKP